MAKRYYTDGEKIWIKALKKEGKVVSLDIPNLTASISFFEENGDLITRKMKFMEIDKLKKKNVTLTGKVKTKRKAILVKYFDQELTKLEKIEKGDWIDLRSAITIEYKAGEFIKLPLGVAISLPFDYEAHVAPRGSTFKNYGVIQVNSVGVVDESYRGNDDQWFVPFYALRDGRIEKNDRVCQFRIMEKMEPIDIITVDELKAPNRGGHGSTGVK